VLEDQGHTDEADADADRLGVGEELGFEHRAAATAEDEPEGAKELGAQPGGQLGGVQVYSRSEEPQGA
jgi:hypothetical protein